MNLLSMEHFTKIYGDRRIFDDASFFLQEAEKVGVIGVNGAGKSTLLKMLAGVEEPDEGGVVKANGTVVAYLPQHPAFAEDRSVLDCVLDYAAAGRADRNGEGHQDMEVRAKTMLTRLGVADFSQKARELSGGQRKRLALAGVLLMESDLLILDEPTNHLDNEMADWLEEQLKGRKAAMVMVTHDRYFLDSVCNCIAEVDRGKLYRYQGGYSAFLERKAQREEAIAAGERKRKSLLRTELAWVQRGARARSTKQKARLERFEELKNRQAPDAEKKVELQSVSSRLGRTTLEVSHLDKSYGDRTLIRDFSYIFLKDDRVGFIGKNGCGKTTLMRMLAGVERPDGGTVEAGKTVKIGYYAQELNHMDPDQRVIDYIREAAEFVRTEEGTVSASAMLERFLFEGSAQYSPIGRLSGGEKRRLNLLRVLMEAPNVLILDEPTNDLDLVTLTVLEDYLDRFPGIVIAVSHDRYFLDRTVGRIFAFEEGGRLVQYEGGYSDYALKKSMEGLLPEREEGARPLEKKKDGRAGGWKKGLRRLKFSYMEQKEYGAIEGEIAGLESKIRELDEEIGEAVSDYGKLSALMQEKEKASARLEEKMERWMFLEEKAARIEAGEMEEENDA